jgi:uncharacterized membrane protein YebE (DUF533 family)
MIYDIGMAYGKSKVLNKELLAGILMTAMGASAGSLLIMQGNKVLVKRVALRVFQRIIALSAGKVTQQALKSLIGKWLPGVGAVAMAVWSNYFTRQVGKKAIEIFEKEIEMSEEVVEEMPLETESAIISTIGGTSTPNISPDIPKVQTLVNLARVDGAIQAEEREYIEIVVGNAGLTESEKADLRQAIYNKRGKSVVDYAIFATSPADAIGLLVDMVRLAKCDGAFHATERIFVKQVGKVIGFSDSDIDNITAAAG